MSGHNVARTLPPGDRDDAPSFDLGGAIRDTPLVHDDAPPLTDETDAARLAKLSRTTAEGHNQLTEALRLLAEGKHQLYAAAISRCADLLTEAAALSRVLSRSHTAKR